MTDEIHRKVRLITPNSLTGNGVGSLFLRDLIAATPEVGVVVARVPRFLLDSQSERYSRIWRFWGLLWSRGARLQGLRLQSIGGLCFLARSRRSPRRLSARAWIAYGSRLPAPR